MKISLSQGPKLMYDTYDGTTGLYLAGTYTKASNRLIQDLCRFVQVPIPDKTKLHTTIMYSEKGRPSSVDVFNVLSMYDHSFPVEANHLTVFEGHDDLYYTVIELSVDTPNGQKLLSLHDHLQYVGARHSYPTFQPHITLQGTEVDPRESSIFNNKIAEVNANFKSIPLNLELLLQKPSKLFGV